MGIFLANTAIGRAILNSASYAAVKALLGLDNVTNTSDASKPVSTATQTALDLKANLASPTFTGTPAAPTASGGTNTTQLATTAFVQSALSGLTGVLTLKGSTDCSANPNYPSASKGDSYIVSVAGIIGGASGKAVDVGDMYIATANNAGGTEASVGTSWTVVEHNLAGAMLSANNLSDLANAGTARTNLGLGTAATANTGTSGAVLGLLNGANTFSALQTLSPTFSNANGVASAISVSPTASTTSSGGWTAILANVTQSTDTGSGNKYLIDLQLAGASKFRVDSAGNAVIAAGAMTITTSGVTTTQTINVNNQCSIGNDGLFVAGQFQGKYNGYGAIASCVIDIPGKVIGMMSDYVLAWSGTAQNTSDGFYSHARSVGLAQAANGILEVNTGTAGTLAYLKAKSVIVTRATPASSSEAGNAGEIWADATYIYVQTASGTVKRVALSTF